MTELRPGPEMKAAALKHVERGWRVFPCVERTKRPCDEPGLFEHGCKGATKSPFWIGKFWSRWPGANPAVATGPASGIWVLDIDVKNGVDGFATLAVLESFFGPLPSTLGQQTPTGGAQRFFVWPDGREVRNRNSKALGPGLDVRGEGGYIMVPPSIHPDCLEGPRYRWDADPEAQPAVHAPEWLLRYVVGDTEDLEWLRRQVEGKLLPEWMAKRLKVSAPPPEEPAPVSHQRALPPDGIHPYARKALDDEVLKVRTAPSGTRNETLNESAFVLGGFVGGGLLPQGLVEQHLHAATQAWPGVPPEKRKRDAETLKRALTEGMLHPRELPPPPEPRARPTRVGPSGRGAAAGNDDVSTQAQTAQANAARSLWAERSKIAPNTPAGQFLVRHGLDPAEPWPMLGAAELPWVMARHTPQQRGPCVLAALLRWSPEPAREVSAVYCVCVSDNGAPVMAADPATGTMVYQRRMVGSADGAVIPLTPLSAESGGRLLLVVGLGAGLRLKRVFPNRPLWVAVNLSHAGKAVLPPYLADVTLLLPDETPVEREQWAIQRLAAAGRVVRVTRQTLAQGRVA
ncbi:bifunctional DNA primase/polymerase (plasmid) [Azospirillum sp. HJ39]|uniref:bifunctional DNA primase/polymerase n=1 Tax=Azospirillum sp. HJ39 TaxID=3159496 RepID=UPI003557F007